MTEEERLKDKKQRQWSLVLIIIGFVFFTIYQWNNRPSRVNSISNQQTETTHDEIHSHVDEPNIVNCPKCGKPYNKNTWGEMCNTCWTEGRGLKSKGEYIIK